MMQDTPTYRFVRYQLPFILWAAVIFASSSIPGRNIPKISIPNADKIAHFLIFMVFCALTDRAIKFQDRFPLLAKHHLVFSVLITITYGVIDEGHQLFVPNRDASLNDLAADGIGALLYVGAALLWTRVQRRKTQTT